jgi:hypothetical protein
MTGTMRASMLVGFVGAALLGVAQGQDKPQPVPAVNSLNDIDLGDVVSSDNAVDATELLNLWAPRLKASIVADPQMAGLKIPARETDQKTTWGSFKKVLDFHDVVVEENEASGHLIVFAHLRRNIACRVAPPFQVIPPSDPIPARDAIVTAFVQIKHGAANDIFATVRGLLVRDVNRIGNILYVRGPEVIIISDFASNCTYYKKIIEQLDIEGPQLLSRVYSLKHAPAEDVARIVHGLYPASSNSSLYATQAVGDARSNRLVVRAPKEQLDEIQALLVELDVDVLPVARPAVEVDPANVLDTKFGLKLEDESAATESARVLEVLPGSVAATRDLRKGDRILAMNGEKIGNARLLVQTLAKLTAEDAITFRIARGDWQREVKILEPKSDAKK